MGTTTDLFNNIGMHMLTRSKVQILEDLTKYFNYHCPQKAESRRRSQSHGRYANILNFLVYFSTT